MDFKLLGKDKDSGARLGQFNTDHGTIHTPIFMPVGTRGTVKGVHPRALKDDIKAQIILGNTFHLYLNPGAEIITEAGGIHHFISWDRPILTDSGGHQVYSLANSRKISEEGVAFKAPTDGSHHFFTPESIIDIERKIGADIIMAFDECTPFPCPVEYASASMERTHRWLDRCINRYNGTECPYGYKQYLFPIVQGSTFADLRKKSAEFIASKDAAGNAIGGLSVGEPHEEMYAITELVCSILPEDKPRYLMGVGTPANILESIALGIDMFDCVIPTRNGRNGMLFTYEGVMNMRNAKWKNDHSPLDEADIIFTDLTYSKAFVRHLMVNNEMLGAQIVSLHNLGFYLDLVRKAREHIANGTFRNWKDKMVPILSRRL